MNYRISREKFDEQAETVGIIRRQAIVQHI